MDVVTLVVTGIVVLAAEQLILTANITTTINGIPR